MIHRKYRLPVCLSVFTLVLAFSQNTLADWRLNSEASALYYTTSKAAAVSEVNTFSEMSGSIDNSGNASLIISLGSVNTAIEVRDQRMREILFQVATYPLARVSMQADGALLSSLVTGESIRGQYQASLELHGQTQQLTAELVITKLLGGSLQVNLAKPLIINAAMFGLAEGVEQLREIAGLPSINGNVVVDFSLLYDMVN